MRIIRKKIKKLRAGSLVLLAFFFIVGGFLARPSLAEYALNKAGYYFNGGSYDLSVATKLYKVAALLGSKSPLVHYQLARIYFVENKLSEAKKEIDFALVENPDNQRAFYVRGLINGFAKNYEEAISDFEKFTAWSSQEWAGWNDLAWVSYEADDYAKSKEAALRGLKIDANNPWLMNNLGLAYLELGEKDEAKNIFAKTKERTATLTLEEWQKAYPGNDPNMAENELVKFKFNLEYNTTLASARSASFIALNKKGFAVSACAASSYNTCSAETCQATPCTVCDSIYDTNCCAALPNQCSVNADCITCVPNKGTSCGSCGGTVACDGSCSVSTPASYGNSCGSCGGTVICSGWCNAYTSPNYGIPCGSCGGTITCNGRCSIMCCGSASGKVYPFSATDYGLDTQCSSGASSNTAFPAVGSSAAWLCLGTNGGEPSIMCSASRSAASENKAPVITAPDSVEFPFGETASFNFSVTDEDSSQVAVKWAWTDDYCGCSLTNSPAWVIDKTIPYSATINAAPCSDSDCSSGANSVRITASDGFTPVSKVVELMPVVVSCEPWYVSTPGNKCSKSCGGGTKVVGHGKRADCSEYNATEACSSQPCPPGYREVTPW